MKSDVAEVLSLTPRQLQQKRDAGALLVDTRTDHQFDDAHVPGAICIPLLRAGFGSRLAWLADREHESSWSGATTTTAGGPPGWLWRSD